MMNPNSQVDELLLHGRDRYWAVVVVAAMMIYVFERRIEHKLVQGMGFAIGGRKPRRKYWETLDLYDTCLSVTRLISSFKR